LERKQKDKHISQNQNGKKFIVKYCVDVRKSTSIFPIEKELNKPRKGTVNGGKNKNGK
jgi:hypothetical protein